MANPLFDSYIPAVADIDAATLQTTRDKLSALWLQFDPEADVYPGFPLGDRVISGMAGTIACLEEGMRRFMSDCDPDNVAAGVMYNCAFIESFLNWFGVYAQPDNPCTGVVRLTFSADITSGNPLVLDRGLRFTANTDTNAPEFSLLLPQPGPLYVLGTNDMGSDVSDPNVTRLVEIGASLFAVDVTVVSPTVTTVSSGNSMFLSTIPANLATATAVADFHDGSVPTALSSLAARTRDTAYAATPTQLGGLRRFVKQALPNVSLVSCAGPGDQGMIRGSANALGVPINAVDVYVRGSNAFTTEVQTVRLTYDSVYNRFIGPWTPIETPLLVNSVCWSGNVQVQLTNISVWGQSGSPATLSLLTAAGTGQENYWITCDMPVDSSSNPLVSISTVGGVSFAWFQITFLSDPAVASARSVLLAPENKPVGIDVQVKPFTTVVLSSVLSTYRRKPGVMLSLTNAQTEIYNNIIGCGYPDVLSEAAWIDSLYYAGAKSVVGFNLAGSVVWTVADKWLPDNASPPTIGSALPSTFLDMDNSAPGLNITSTTASAFTPVITDTSVYKLACGPLTLAWYVDTSDIIFSEHA